MIGKRNLPGEYLTDVPDREFNVVDVPEPQKPKKSMWKRAIKFVAKKLTSPKVTPRISRYKDEVILVVRLEWMGVDAAIFATVDTGLDGDRAGVELKVLFEQREIFRQTKHV